MLIHTLSTYTIHNIRLWTYLCSTCCCRLPTRTRTLTDRSTKRREHCNISEKKHWKWVCYNSNEKMQRGVRPLIGFDSARPEQWLPNIYGETTKRLELRCMRSINKTPITTHTTPIWMFIESSRGRAESRAFLWISSSYPDVVTVRGWLAYIGGPSEGPEWIGPQWN